MASVDTDICNLALGLIGDKRIQTTTERSVEASECARYYPQARDEALEAFDWPFARSFAVGVAPNGVSSLPGYFRAYVWPSDAIAIRGIARDLTSEPSPEFVRSSVIGPDGDHIQVLHTNKTGGIIVYTRRETNVAAYSPLFVRAVAANLAHYIAMPLTKKETKRDEALKLYREALEHAAVSAGNQGRAALSADIAPDWIRARG